MGRRLIVTAIAGAGVAVVAGALLFVSGEQGSQAARSVPQMPAREDPLTGQEVARATTIASAGSRSHMAAGRIKLLYVERDDDKDISDRRRADAYLYDYGSDRLIVRTVDLGQGTVVRETVARGCSRRRRRRRRRRPPGSCWPTPDTARSRARRTPGRGRAAGVGGGPGAARADLHPVRREGTGQAM